MFKKSLWCWPMLKNPQRLTLMYFLFLCSMWKGLNVNCTDSSGYTPLHHASLNGHR